MIAGGPIANGAIASEGARATAPYLLTVAIERRLRSVTSDGRQVSASGDGRVTIVRR